MFPAVAFRSMFPLPEALIAALEMIAELLREIPPVEAVEKFEPLN